MSSSSRNSTAKSTDDRALHHPSATSERAFTSSIYPWYYVPGRVQLTERRLAAKYAKEAQRYRENDEINKYFRKCNSELKLFSNWQNHKPLVKYRYAEADSLTPFYTEDDAAQRDMAHSLYLKCGQTISALLGAYEEASLKYKQNFIDCNLVIKYLFEYMEIYKSVKERRALLMAEIGRYLEPALLYSSLRDPLRQVCFLIKEALYFFKKEIFNIMKLLKPVYGGKFLDEHEQTELDQLNSRCFQIIDMYIQLNDIRNDHFQQMFDEERENAWGQQKQTWKSEILVWDNLIVKLLQSNYLLIRDKLEDTLGKQKALFEDRLNKFHQLAGFADEIKSDTALQPVLYKDISQLLRP